jgi:hypothetical protein
LGDLEYVSLKIGFIIRGGTVKAIDLNSRHSSPAMIICEAAGLKWGVQLGGQLGVGYVPKGS